MSLYNYFDPKPKKSKKSAGSKRKLSDDTTTTIIDADIDAPEKKRQRLSKVSKKQDNSDSDDEVGTGTIIPFSDKITNENANNTNNSNNNNNNNNNNSKKGKNDENEESKDTYVSDDDEEEEEDFDISGNDKTKTKSKSKNKAKSKSKLKSKTADDNNNNNTNNDDIDEKELSTGAVEDWDTIKSKIDISKLTYAQCDQLLHPSWKQELKNEFTKPYYTKLRKNLSTEEKSGAEIFPPVHHVFRAFELCPWDSLKVVLLGQDPYHDNGQAEGLCFSVPRGIKVPSSLKNMYKEGVTDIGMKTPNHGSLVEWGKQGVLLLNTVLTVRAHKANSHAKYGWQDFTDAVIKKISNSHSGVVFILWGKQAQKKKILIDKSKHRIVESAHPSGLSASRGFYGSKPYSKTNQLLKELGKSQIDWKITPK